MSFILGIIPARGGSKGIPKKNIAPLCGKPLIAYTLDAAVNSKRLSDTIVSTDSQEIADIASDYGANVPFLRPAELSDDFSPTINAVIHAVKEYEKLYNKYVNIVALLQPTAPLRTSEDIDKSIELMINNPSSSSLISCYNCERVHPRIMYTIDNNIGASLFKDHKVGVRRQDFEDVYVRNGAIYLTKRKLLNEDILVDENPICYIMPERRSINIDSTYDIELAECLLSKASR
jgi:CMP-N-acetylneuraminic acid synthetase